jgi:hypothetical protein
MHAASKAKLGAWFRTWQDWNEASMAAGAEGRNKSGVDVYNVSGVVVPQFQQDDHGKPSIATATLFSEAMTMSRA